MWLFSAFFLLCSFLKKMFFSFLLYNCNQWCHNCYCWCTYFIPKVKTQKSRRRWYLVLSLNFKMLHTLYVWIFHEVKQAREQGVSCCVSPSEMKIQYNGTKLVFRKWRVSIPPLFIKKSELIMVYITSITENTTATQPPPCPAHPSMHQWSGVASLELVSFCFQWTTRNIFHGTSYK